MATAFDVIVLGLGANGSSALYHLSQTGCTVLGIDRFTPPHSHGSSHGQSRIIRQAYHESPLYVPLVQEAYRHWADIEKTSGRQLLLKTGGIMLGSASAAVIKGARLSAGAYNIPSEYLDCNDIRTRFPALKPASDTVAVLDKDAGILFPEICIQAYLDEAQKNGAQLRYNERVIRILPNKNGVEIRTDKATYQAGSLVVSAGAWLTELMPELQLPLTVERQVLYWFRSKKPQPHLTPERLPVYIWEYASGKTFYGFPDLGHGIKIAFHHDGQTIAPDALAPDVSQAEIDGMMEVTRTYLNMEPVFNYAATCMYTNTPDKNFIIDFHPRHQNIVIASPCSGHGFKFASLTGKLLCDMIFGRAISFDLSPFRISR